MVFVSVSCLLVGVPSHDRSAPLLNWAKEEENAASENL